MAVRVFLSVRVFQRRKYTSIKKRAKVQKIIDICKFFVKIV